MTTIAPPLPQHMAALDRANRVRLARAELKRAVARGEVMAADVVLDVPAEAEGMRIADLLTSQHRWGRSRCRSLLAGLMIPENKPIGSMTDRQRNRLADDLRGVPAPAPPLPTPSRPVVASAVEVRRTRKRPAPSPAGASGLGGLVSRVHARVWNSGDFGLTEHELARLLRADPNDVAEACGRLLLDGSFVLRPDGSYYRPDPAGIGERHA